MKSILLFEKKNISVLTEFLLAIILLGLAAVKVAWVLIMDWHITGAKPFLINAEWVLSLKEA